MRESLSSKNMKITVDGQEFDIQHKRIRLDALFELVGLNPMEDKLILVNADLNTTEELCSLHLIVEVFNDMCFITC